MIILNKIIRLKTTNNNEYLSVGNNIIKSDKFLNSFSINYLYLHFNKLLLFLFPSIASFIYISGSKRIP